MIYTDDERRVLNLLQRTDFKNLSKNDFLGFVSKIGKLRPEIASDVIAQFPEFACLMRDSLSTFKDTLGKVLESDDRSVQEVYDIANKRMDYADKSRAGILDLANKIWSDLNKSLDNPGLSAEQQKEILEQEMEIFRIVSEKDKEIRDQDMETVKYIYDKDSEKRGFNWKALGAASAMLIITAGAAVAALGGDFNFKND